MDRKRTICFGELLLRLSAPGRERLLQSPRLEVNVGGAEANVAVSLARFGHEVALVSVVADNALGEAATGELRRQGVDTRAVTVAPGRMGLYFLVPGAIHRPSEVIYDRADSAFTRAAPNSYDWPALLQDAAWLHLSGVTPALGHDCARTALAAARAARAAGVRVCFDGNFRSKLWQTWDGDASRILRDLMGEADLLLADHRDIAVALGEGSDAATGQERVARAAELAFAAFPRLQYLASTVREQRSVDHHLLSALLVERDGTRHRAPEFEIAPIVDRIGAGDAFAAGLLHGLLTRMGLAESVRFALGAACLKHSIPGDFNLLGVADVDAFLGSVGYDVRR